MNARAYSGIICKIRNPKESITKLMKCSPDNWMPKGQTVVIKGMRAACWQKQAKSIQKCLRFPAHPEEPLVECVQPGCREKTTEMIAKIFAYRQDKCIHHQRQPHPYIWIAESHECEFCGGRGCAVCSIVDEFGAGVLYVRVL